MYDNWLPLTTILLTLLYIAIEKIFKVVNKVNYRDGEIKERHNSQYTECSRTLQIPTRPIESVNTIATVHGLLPIFERAQATEWWFFRMPTRKIWNIYFATNFPIPHSRVICRPPFGSLHPVGGTVNRTPYGRQVFITRNTWLNQLSLLSLIRW